MTWIIYIQLAGSPSCCSWQLSVLCELEDKRRECCQAETPRQHLNWFLKVCVPFRVGEISRVTVLQRWSLYKAVVADVVNKCCLICTDPFLASLPNQLRKSLVNLHKLQAKNWYELKEVSISRRCFFLVLPLYIYIIYIYMKWNIYDIIYIWYFLWWSLLLEILPYYMNVIIIYGMMLKYAELHIKLYA